MHPWMMQCLAEERRHELGDAARRARAWREARGARPAHLRIANHMVSRHLGELLIRTGRRLVGPEAPASGVRDRFAWRGSSGATADSC
jgi:hypothetical protein